MQIGTLVIAKKDWGMTGVDYGVGIVVQYAEGWESNGVFWSNGDIQWWDDEGLEGLSAPAENANLMCKIILDTV